MRFDPHPTVRVYCRDREREGSQIIINRRESLSALLREQRQKKNETERESGRREGEEEMTEGSKSYVNAVRGRKKEGEILIRVNFHA